MALVEFALILPVFVLLLFGLLDFGRALSYWLDQKHLAHEAARFAAVDFVPPGGVSIQRYVHDQAETPEMRNGGTSSVPAPGIRVCIDLLGKTRDTVVVGDPVKVTATLTFRWLQILGLSATQSTLTASSTQRVENDRGTSPVGYNPSGGSVECHDP